MSELHFLNEELNRLASFTDKGDSIDKSISMASVKWHLQHTLIVINKIIPAVEASDPKQFKPTFNFKRHLIFSLNKIPRGKGKAPKQVRPDGDISKEGIEKEIEKARGYLLKLNELDKNAFFNHPLFGDLNLKNTKRFLRLHTVHHLKIIEDIVGK